MSLKRVSRNARGLAVVAVGLAVGWAAAGPASADGLTIGGSAKDRAGLFRSQVALLDGRLSQQYAYSARLKPGAGKDGADNVRYSGHYRGLYLEMAKDAARKYGVPEDLFLRLVQQESGWNPDVVSVKGAVGLAQLMPGTASLLGVDETNPEANLDGGARYLAMMFNRFGSWKLALAAYNAGPDAVDAAGGIPDFEETQNYVAAILG